MEKQDPVVTKLAQNMELFILTANQLTKHYFKSSTSKTIMYIKLIGERILQMRIC